MRISRNIVTTDTIDQQTKSYNFHRRFEAPLENIHFRPACCVELNSSSHDGELMADSLMRARRVANTHDSECDSRRRPICGRLFEVFFDIENKVSSYDQTIVLPSVMKLRQKREPFFRKREGTA
jgi:hypothetical protein